MMKQSDEKKTSFNITDKITRENWARAIQTEIDSEIIKRLMTVAKRTIMRDEYESIAPRVVLELIMPQSVIDYFYNNGPPPPRRSGVNSQSR